MDKGYTALEAALKKLLVAKGLGQTVYIYGANGYDCRYDGNYRRRMI